MYVRYIVMYTLHTATYCDTHQLYHHICTMHHHLSQHTPITLYLPNVPSFIAISTQPITIQEIYCDINLTHYRISQHVPNVLLHIATYTQHNFTCHNTQPAHPSLLRYTSNKPQLVATYNQLTATYCNTHLTYCNLSQHTAKTQ